MRTTRRAVRLGAITLAAAVLTGCSVTGDDGAAKGSTAATSQDATKDAGAGNTDTVGSGAGLADVSPEEIIAEQTYTVPGSPDDKVTVGVHSLVVDGEMMTLSLYFTPDFGSESDEAEISVFDMVGSAFGPTLIDRANLSRST